MSHNEIILKAFKRHLDAADKSINSALSAIEKGAEILAEALRRGNKILACGNGGSAADSEHFAAEFLVKYKDDRRPLPAISLVGNVSALTAAGNDYGFEKIFSRQIEALGRPGDVLVAFTTSGRSKNILNAIEQAEKSGLKIIVLTGEGGKELGGGARVLIVVPSLETARIQEVHEVIYHAWCEYIDASL